MLRFVVRGSVSDFIIIFLHLLLYYYYFLVRNLLSCLSAVVFFLRDGFLCVSSSEGAGAGKLSSLRLSQSVCGEVEVGEKQVFHGRQEKKMEIIPGGVKKYSIGEAAAEYWILLLLAAIGFLYVLRLVSLLLPWIYVTFLRPAKSLSR